MEGGNPVAEIAHQRRRERAALRHAVEQLRLVEAPHDQHPVDRRRAAEGEPTGGAAADRTNLEIELRRRPPVERELGAAGGLAALEGGIVEIGEADRPLQLVGIGPGQEDERGVGLDPLDGTGVGAVGIRLRQEGDGLALIIAGSRRHRCLRRTRPAIAKGSMRGLSARRAEAASFFDRL